MEQQEKKQTVEEYVQQQQEEREKNGETGFYVVPKMNCPHIAKVKLVTKGDVKDPCKTCQNVGENWICGICGDVFCSRYVKGHMMEHNKATKHSIAVSFSDLSAWCYECDAYIKHFSIAKLLNSLHESKFGSAPPKGSEDSKPSNLNSNSFANRVGVITDDDEIKEHFDSPEELQQKVKLFASWVRESKHMVCYTGAGISTSSKIADYRGPQGFWTLKAQGKSPVSIDLEAAFPNKGHMSIYQLVQKGIMKFVVSTNVDGLHMRSGLTSTHLAELHGNIYLEKCPVCSAGFLRYFDVTTNTTTNHLTGRKCENKIDYFNEKTGKTAQMDCDGMLKDSIIHFGENLPVDELQKSINHSAKADIRLVLGTSMRVAPANKLPLENFNKQKDKLVIVNLQKTPFDSHATLRVFAKTDDFFELLMKELALDVPDYQIDFDTIKKDLAKME